MAHFKVLVCLVLLACIALTLGQRNNRQNNRFNNNRRQNRQNNRFNNNRPVNNRPVNNNRPANNRRPQTSTNQNPLINNGRFRATPANARDKLGNEVYPGCNGTVCLPEANLCARRKNKPGHFTFGGKSYWISWASDETTLRNARWNWFTGRNYCRKMCMDMVSFESRAEQNFVEGLMKASNVDNVHSAGRLCDAEVEGCDAPRFQPLNINGWFWASTLRMMPPTNLRSNNVFNNWGPGQPNGRVKSDGFGTEACTALLQKNGQYQWYDEPCNTRRQLVCEDLPTPNINFVRNQNPGVNIP